MTLCRVITSRDLLFIPTASKFKRTFSNNSLVQDNNKCSSNEVPKKGRSILDTKTRKRRILGEISLRDFVLGKTIVDIPQFCFFPFFWTYSRTILEHH
jgi:hypothetical protein